MKRNTLVAALSASLMMLGAASLSNAASITGAYSIGDGSDGNQAFTVAGIWGLTATNSTFSYVARTVDQNITFADLTNLNAVFNSVTGSGGGSPRISVGLETGSGEKFLHIFLGNTPNYIDTSAALNFYSGVNLIGNNDAGRYDDSQFSGGNPYTTYADALTRIGGLKVDEIDFVVDTFDPYGNRTIKLTSINAEYAGDTTAVPLPSSAGMGLAAIGGLALAAFMRKKTHTA